MAAHSTPFADGDSPDEPKRIHADHARVEQSAIRWIDAEEVHADRSAIQRVQATSATLDHSAAGTVSANHATIRQSTVGAVVTRSAACDEVRTGILVSPVVRGDVHTWLDMRTAVAIGIGFFAGKLILDVVRGAIRRVL